MATFLLYWNPYFSSYKLDRFLYDFDFEEGREVLTDKDDWDRSPDDFNWSIVEHEKAREGDRFIFVKVGYEKPTRVIGVCHFSSEPYKGAYWSGQGRIICYMDMEWESVVKPDTDKVLPTSQLIEAILSRNDPNVPVEVGHSSCTVCNLGNIAMELGRPVKWNPIVQKCMHDPEATALLHYDYRAGYGHLLDV